MGCITAGLAWFSGIDADGGFVADLLGPELLAGFGSGLVVVAVTISATAEAAPEESGLVSGLLNATQQVGMSIGIAVLITVATAVSGAATTPARCSRDIGPRSWWRPRWRPSACSVRP